MAKRILFFIIIFLLSIQVIIDTDFGWHLRTGEYIVNAKSVPKTDIFSFSQPDYHYVYHSWGAEVLIYFSYFWFGLYGVSALYATVLTLSIFFLYKTVLLIQKEFNPIIFLCLTLLAHSIAGGRTRVFGFLMVTILYYFFIKYQKQKSKLIYLTPLLFFLWANLHGSFILGIFIFAIMLTANSIQRKFLDKKMLILFLLSLSSTLISPYFINAAKQALQMSINSYGISSTNADWQSLVNPQTSGWIFAVLVIFITLLAQLYKIKVDNFTKTYLAIFFVLSAISSKFTIALLVFFAPVANTTVLYFQKKIRGNILKSLPVKTSLIALIIILLLFPVKNILEIQFAYKSQTNYSLFLGSKSKGQLYPAWSLKADNFIDSNLKNTRIFNDGNWGGLMLYKNPYRKVFYYQAMDNFIVKGQSFAFEYLSIINTLPGWENKIEKYQINTIYLPPNTPLVQKLKNNKDWQTVYEDNLAVVITKR